MAPKLMIVGDKEVRKQLIKNAKKTADKWSIGCVIFELFTCEQAFKPVAGYDHFDANRKSLKITEPDLNSLPATVKYLVEGCLEREPTERISIDTVKESIVAAHLVINLN